MDWQTLCLPSIIEDIPLGVVVTRRNGHIAFANMRAILLLGTQAHMLAGCDLGAMRIQPRRPRAVKESLGGCLRQELSSFVTASGRVCALETTVPMYDEQGEVSFFVHFLQQLSRVCVVAR